MNNTQHERHVNLHAYTTLNENSRVKFCPINLQNLAYTFTQTYKKKTHILKFELQQQNTHAKTPFKLIIALQPNKTIANQHHKY